MLNSDTSDGVLFSFFVNNLIWARALIAIINNVINPPIVLEREHFQQV